MDKTIRRNRACIQRALSAYRVNLEENQVHHSKEPKILFSKQH
jgi:hypothetical protein